MGQDAPSLDAILDRIAQAQVPGATGIAKLRRVSGGANMETWSFEATTPTGGVPLILRRAPGGKRQARETAPSLETEARVIVEAGKAGVPVPPVRYVLRPEDGAGEGFIMDFVAGETIARKILRDAEFANARPILARQCGEILAKLHAVPKETLPPLHSATPRAYVEQQVEYYRSFNHPHPVFELALRWLLDHAPPHDKQGLVHGDFRNGNLIIGPDGVRAVLDWEIVHFGDPMEDLGYICVNSWRFGNIDHPVGGFGPREDLFAGYEAASGTTIDPERVKWWEVLGTLKWGVGCMTMARVFREGIDTSVERATIGRRASECEIDLLRLLAPRQA
ncbi:phosphotransferase family protein [Zavarzinia sp. CC-PAN008]|uniref:phosphotransferase family protein n=1 Tax=Zavarzinia sp. CC-PAN008 TaxID=3243332 RepID=UPI003F74AAF3